MKISTSRSPRVIDDAYLRRMGFTPEQISRLSELRESYKLFPHFEPRLQRQWLTFVKWCYLNGRINV